MKELLPGLSVEEIKALFFDQNALRESPYKCYQLNTPDYRYYYTFDDKGEPTFYPSVTTLLRQVMPTSPFLLKWMMENGKESIEKRDLAAAYGTFMHIQFERLIIDRVYNFDDIPVVLREYMTSHGLPEALFGEWLTKIRKDVLAFAQFIIDYNVKPLAIEIGLVHPTKHYAGCIDLPCVMYDPKTGEEYRAIVDFKSGRKGFFEEHELQLHLYKDMWNVNFPDLKVERVYNFSPKDWRTKPTYNLKDQTESENAKKIPYLLELAAIEDSKRDNTLTIVQGSLDLDKGRIMDNVTTLSLSDIVKGKTKPEPKPEIAENVPKVASKRVKAEKGTRIPPKERKPVESKKTENLFLEPEPKAESTEPEKLPWEQSPEKAEKEDLLNLDFEL